MTTPTPQPQAVPYRFIGTQPAFEHLPAMDLFNLLLDLPGYCKGSTVSRQTLERLGVWVEGKENKK